MRSKEKLLFGLVLFFISTIGVLLYFAIQPKPQIQNLSSSPTPTISISPTLSVLGSSKSLCHAIQVDAADPQAVLPDPDCTPGVIDPAVTQENIFMTICKSGYTKTVRPPASYTNALKKEQIIEYGYSDTDLKNYEEDHFISLELGGSPKDPKNLWPEPHPSMNEKDKVENYLHAQICSGKLTLSEAQEKITKNWYVVYLQIKP